ncbi:MULTISPECIES: hypothetical protein [Methanobacterium]|nr:MULTISPECIES: hypothetical protein [Methanobacterium]
MAAANKAKRSQRPMTLNNIPMIAEIPTVAWTILFLVREIIF